MVARLSETSSPLGSFVQTLSDLYRSLALNPVRFISISVSCQNLYAGELKL
jgi:hypothetical protein